MKKKLIATHFATVMVAAMIASGATATAQQEIERHFPCPSINIGEKTDHVPNAAYRQKGWDTVVNCANQGVIELNAEPYIPVQYFTGQYKVEMIDFNPPDPTFYMEYPGSDTPTKKRMDISQDDYFAPSPVNIAFPFYFFGIRKTKFRLGDNGLVTFCDSHNLYDASGNKCDWSCPVALPWASASGDIPFGFGTNCMRDAIYGVYQDTHLLPSTISGNQGIYYGVINSPDDDHCRVIVATWNEVPLFSSQTAPDKRQTYQIVCYEGSNIIEVHIKHRSCTAGTCSGKGLVGIQNATGAPQEKGARGSSNEHVVAGSPAFFAPRGWNSLTCGTTITDSIVYSADSVKYVTFNASSMDSIAYRFTPLGRSQKTVEWYRIFDDGRDSIMLTENVNDTNGYFIPMHDDPTQFDYDSVHPTLTKAIVKPTVPSRYVVSLRWLDAEGNEYVRSDTISIGVDFSNDLSLKSITPLPDTARQIDLCNGTTSAMQLSWPSTQTADTIRWRVERMMNGERSELPESMYTLENGNTTVTIHPDPRFDTLPENHIDSIRVMASVDFISHCTNYDTFTVRVYPNFDTVHYDGICQGETYVWDANGQSYTVSTDEPVARLRSVPGCDSVVHLHLTVYDVQHKYDTVDVCNSYRWRNGRTYIATNTNTRETDTVKLVNQYNCDSIVHLVLTVYPTAARIECDVEEFTYDKMEAMLTDISTGSTGRLWLLPTVDANGDSTTVQATDPVVYYTIPDTLDGAHIYLIAASPYGCMDTASIYLPFRKETVWVPTIFMPDDQGNNNIFRAYSTNAETQEMWIYDRAGRLVAHCQGVGCGWDGRDLNGNPCPQGGYVYLVNYTTKYNPRQMQSKHGSVTLVR